MTAPAPRRLTDEQAIFEAGAAEAGKWPPMSRETAARIAPRVSAALAELQDRAEEHVPAA